MKIVVVEILTVVLLAALFANAHPMYRRRQVPKFGHAHIKPKPVMYGPGYGPVYGGGPRHVYRPPGYGGGHRFRGGLGFGAGLQLLASVALLGTGNPGAQGLGALGFLGLG